MKNLIERLRNEYGEIYQDIVLEGQLLAKGRRDCDKRWMMVGPQINPHSVVMDLGSATGYFSKKIAQTYPDSLVISFESDPLMCEIQKEIYRREGIYNVVVCQHRLTLEEIDNWNDHVEFFDTLLALSVLHHFEDGKKVLDSLSKMFPVIIGEVPGEEKEACGVFGGEIGERETLGYVSSHLGKYKREVWLKRNLIERSSLNAFFGVSHHDRHRFEIQNGTIGGKEIIKGVNVWNLSYFNIIWPDKKWWQTQVTKAYESLDYKSDVRLWNLLVTPTGVTAIDYMTKFPKHDQAEFKPSDLVALRQEIGERVK